SSPPAIPLMPKAGRLPKAICWEKSSKLARCLWLWRRMSRNCANGQPSALFRAIEAGFLRELGHPFPISTLSPPRPPAPPAAKPEPRAEPLAPVKRPGTSAWRLFRDVLDHGGPGYLQFAITNICNAKCDFCGFAVDRFDARMRRSVTLQEARDVI